MSGATSEDHAAVLRTIAQARLPALPPAPRLRIAALAIAVRAMQRVVWIGVPAFVVLMLGVPFLYRYLTGMRLDSELGLAAWLVGASTFVAFWRAVVRPRAASEPPSFELDARTSPVLFGLLDTIADELGTEQVDRVTAGAMLGFSVSEDGRGRLHLRLEAADLVGFSEAELTSILLHEFAHYGEGHTDTARALHRRARLLFELQDRLKSDSWSRYTPLYALVAGFTYLFRRWYAGISRQHELQADAMAVGILGPETFASALRKAVRNSYLLDARAARYVEPAIAEQALDRDVIQQMRDHVASEGEVEHTERLVHDELTAETAPFDHHPSYADRIAHAVQSGGPRPEVGAAPAYDVLFDRAMLQRRASAELVGQILDRRSASIGVRGVALPRIEGARPELAIRRLRTPVWLVSLLVAGGSVLVLALLTLVAYADPEGWNGTHATLLGFTIALAVGFAWLVLMRRAGTRADHYGLTTKSVLATSQIPWSEVTCVEMTERLMRVRGGIDRTAIVIGGHERDRQTMMDMILEHAPRLAWHGWGTGLSRVGRPDTPDAELPDTVLEKDDGILLAGPGTTRVHILRSHPDYEEIREALQVRLLPEMEARGIV